MKSTVETLGPTRVRLAVEVPFEELKPSFDAAYKKIGAQVRIPGFRPGKAPARIIDQVVDDHVNGSADLKAAEIGEIERFGHDPLTCEGTVAVQHHRDDSCAVRVLEAHLPCSRPAKDDGINGLEVARIRDELYG